MRILVCENIKTVGYSNSQATINDRLTAEVKGMPQNYTDPHWDVELIVKNTSTTIYFQGNEVSSLIEGFNNLYYITPEKKIHWISKKDLYTDVLQKTIMEDIMDSALENGYDISRKDCRSNILKAAILAMKCYVDDKQTLRIPYLLELDLGKTPIGLNYCNVPNYYCVSKDEYPVIISTLANTIQSIFHLKISDTSLPFYTFSGLLSKVVLK